ncbi:MAG: hypothetical protein M3R35_01110 [Candidatus Eremiobacteraeota bacterium]|nr:hypothetical protein [Candidatus Eremiobacteraeota bacterium]
MLAAPQQYEARPRITNVRTAKNATHKRRARTARAQYVGISRFCAGLAVVLAMVMIYVMLMAHLTSMNYALSRAEHQRADLQAQSLRLDDQLARLRSDERLAAIAARFGMRDPQQFAVVKLPPSNISHDRTRLALLSTFAGWLGSR